MVYERLGFGSLNRDRPTEMMHRPPGMYCVQDESYLQSCLSNNSRRYSSCCYFNAMGPRQSITSCEQRQQMSAPAVHNHSPYSLASSNIALQHLIKTEKQRETQADFSSSELHQQPNLTLQEEDLIGRLDECVSDANSLEYSPVDCTLSLSTPSTRLSTSSCKNSFASSSPHSVYYNSWISQQQPTAASETFLKYAGGERGHCYSDLGSRSNDGGTTPFNQNMISYARLANKPGGRSATENSSSATRKCANCDTTTTPLWRNGPKGPKSLCNACGIRFKKEERRIAGCNAAEQQQKDLCKTNEFCSEASAAANAMRERERETSCLTWQGSCSDSSSLAFNNSNSNNHHHYHLAKHKKSTIGSIFDCSFNAHTENNRSEADCAVAEAEALQEPAAGGPILVLGLSVQGK